MKNLKMVMLTALAAVGLAGCGEQPCTEHVDLNHDATCDVCGQTGLEVVHVDTNHDHKCDVCQTAMGGDCKDDNSDLKCDYCGREILLTAVELDTSEVTTKFAKGEQFDYTGLKVIGTTEFGTEVELEFTVTKPSMSSVGTKTVTVNFVKNGEASSLTYEIQIGYWTTDEDTFLKSNTLLGYYGKTNIPYIYGMNLDINQETGEWSAVKEEATIEDYFSYAAKLEAINVKKTTGGKSYTYKLFTEAGNYEGLYDLTDVKVYRLAPYNASGERGFTVDEYYVLGMNDAGSMILKTRTVNAMLDGMFAYANNTLGLLSGFNTTPDVIYEYVAMIPGYYYSEIAAEKFVFPEVSTDADFFLTSLFAAYPFASSLDQYDLALESVLYGATQAEYDAFVLALTTAGFENSVEKPDVYTLSSNYIGEITYVLLPYSETFIDEYVAGIYSVTDGATKLGIANPGFGFDIFYVAPETFVAKVSPDLDAAIAAFGESATEAEIYDDYYASYGCMVATLTYTNAEVTTLEGAIAPIQALLAAAEFPVILYEQYNETNASWGFTVSNPNADIVVIICEGEADGEFSVELDAYAAAPKSDDWTPSINAFVAALGEKATKVGVDYSYSEKYEVDYVYFNYSATAIDQDTPATASSAATEMITALTGASFEVRKASEYDDYYECYEFTVSDNTCDFEVTVYEDPIAEGVFSIEVLVQEAVPQTNELTPFVNAIITTLGDFATGATIDNQWYSTYGCDSIYISHANTGSETEESVIGGIVTALTGAGYTVTTAANDKGTYWMAEVENDDVEVTIYVDDEDEGIFEVLIDVYAATEAPVALTAEQVMQEICKTIFEVETAVLNTHYGYSSTYDYYYTTVNYGNVGSDKLYQVASSAAYYYIPEGWTVDSSQSGTSQSGYIMILTNPNSDVVIQILSYWDAANEKNLVQIITYTQTAE